MEHPRITVTINGKTYSLCAANAEAIGNMPANDRMELIILLEAIKRQDRLSPGAAPKARDESRTSSPPSPPARPAASNISPSGPKSERLGGGDIDALMTRLAAEEKRSRQPGISRAGIYKVTGGLLLVIFLLVAVL
jgi:hypothetical protein